MRSILQSSKSQSTIWISLSCIWNVFPVMVVVLLLETFNMWRLAIILGCCCLVCGSLTCMVLEKLSYDAEVCCISFHLQLKAAEFFALIYPSAAQNTYMMEKSHVCSDWKPNSYNFHKNNVCKRSLVKKSTGIKVPDDVLMYR